MGVCLSCRLDTQKKQLGGRRGKGAAAHLLPRRAAALHAAMANSISNIKMTNPIKGIVSKRRRRYIKDGFNLDLAYITDNLIAMGFPAEKLEGVYRNHIDEVYRFLEHKHHERYKIYNLCSERSYDSAKFHDRVVRYAFDDHCPPKIELIQQFCEDVDEWLHAHEKNVAVVHCKAGKGRTGTMLSCYLLYSAQKATAEEALNYYGTTRTHDEKGVTIPSQRRYVWYFGVLCGSRLSYWPRGALLRSVALYAAPAVLQPKMKVMLPKRAQGPVHFHEHQTGDRLEFIFDECMPLAGDVRVDIFHKPKMMRKEKLFHFWFNTYFAASELGAVSIPPLEDSMNLDTFKLTLNKWELDDAHKDKQHKLFPPDFKVEVIIQRLPPTCRVPPSAGSADHSNSNSDLDDEHWDSGESTYL